MEWIKQIYEMTRSCLKTGLGWNGSKPKVKYGKVAYCHQL